MNVNLNTNTVSTIISAGSVIDGELIVPVPQTSEPVLKGDGVTVSETEGTSDLEKLVALLYQQTNNARENSIIGARLSVADAFVKYANISDEYTEELVTKMTTEADNLVKNKDVLDNLTKELDKVNNIYESLAAYVALQRLQGESDADYAARVRNNGESDKDFAARYAAAEKAVTDTGVSLSEIVEAMKTIQEKVAKLEAQIKAVADKVDAGTNNIESFYGNLGFTARSKLTEFLHLMSSDVEDIKPLEQEEDDDDVKAALDAYKAPMEILREVLDEKATEMSDDVNRQREEHV